jgi:hypothetical protein
MSDPASVAARTRGRSASISLHVPRAARVRTGSAGAPVEVDGRAISSIRESWLVEDAWWTARPLRRRYWEVVTECGRNVVVFRDLTVAQASAQGPGDPGPAHPREARAREGWFVQGA